MLLARGAIQDRPFGKTVGTIAQRGVTGQLTAECDGNTYAIVFDRGHIAAASSPNLSDSAAAIALALDIITPAQIAKVERWLEAVPDADDLQVLATVALMTSEEVHRLRRRVIAQRAARMIALEHGDFVLTSTIAIPTHPDCEMHIGGVIYQAARLYLHDKQLRAVVSALGSRFEMRPEAFDDVPYYGFGDPERPFLRALAAGISLESILQMPAEPDRGIAMSVLYALASCGALYCEPVAAANRFARGTNSPVRGGRITAETPAVERVDAAERLSSPSLNNAEEAFQRAQLALRGDRIDDAVFDLELATELAPNEPRYFAALAWAQFCRAPDKTKVAGKTRAMLGRAIARSDSDILPHYWLGMVERMMNRTDAAIEAFREVLDRQPNHQAAATELRFLTRKS